MISMNHHPTPFVRMKPQRREGRISMDALNKKNEGILNKESDDEEEVASSEHPSS
jgi:hypothetical protein